MKTFFEFMKEDLDADLASFQKKRQTEPPRSNPFKGDSSNSNLNRNLIRKDPPITPKNEPVDTTGANSPFADPSVKSYTPVTSDKPMIGKNDAVAKALAAKGYTRTGEKVNSGSSRPFPDQPNTNTMQDKLNMKRLGADQWHSNFKKKMDEPRPSAPSVKVGSLAVKQNGYPAAEKPKVPVPTAKPKDLVPNKQGADQKIPRPKLRPERKPEITNTDNTKGPVAIPKPDSVGMNVTPETFKKIFARTAEGEKFTWTDPQTGKTGTYIRKTKRKTKKG